MQSIVSIFSSYSIVRRPFLWFLWPNYILPSFNFPAPLSSSSNQDAVISADFPDPSLFYLLPSPFSWKVKKMSVPVNKRQSLNHFTIISIKTRERRRRQVILYHQNRKDKEDFLPAGEGEGQLRD